MRASTSFIFASFFLCQTVLFILKHISIKFLKSKQNNTNNVKVNLINKKNLYIMELLIVFRECEENFSEELILIILLILNIVNNQGSQALWMRLL